MAKINLVTKSLTTLNRVKISLYKEPDRLTIVDSQTFTAPHPQRTITFLDLVLGQDYYFTWTEIDGAGLDIQTYAAANFTVPAYGSIEIKPPENIIVGLTTGLNDGATTFTFDGTGGKPDWRTWEIIIERIGAGTMQKNVSYSWNKVTGVFTLLDGGDFFTNTERFFVEFEPHAVPNSSVVVREAWSEDLIITDDITLTANDFSKNAIIQGADSYLKITLPDIFTVPPGKLIYFDCPPDSVTKCAEIACSAVTGNANLIQYPFPNKNNIYLCPSETFAIYRQKVSNSVSYWRIKFADGNFKLLGEIIGEYTVDVLNKIALTNATYNNLTYARFYNHYILNLPSAQVVTFAQWSVGATNKYKYSLADGSGNFHVPDLRDLYERSSGALIAGAFKAAALLQHSHNVEYVREGNDGQPTNAGQVLRQSAADPGTGSGQAGWDTNTYAIRPTGGADNNPNSYVANKYVRT